MTLNFCPFCGCPVSPGARFCPAHGHDLNAPTGQTPEQLAAADDARLQAAMDAAPKVVDDPTYVPPTPEPGSLQAQMMAENAARAQGAAPQDMLPPPPPPSYDPYSEYMPPPPATPIGVDMPKKAGGGAGSWVAVGFVMAVLGVGAAMFGPALLNSIPSPSPSNNDQTTTSGVSVTAATLESWSTCDNPTKGYLPGASDCKASVTVKFEKPVASGQVWVVLLYGGTANDPDFHGYAAAPTTVSTPVSVTLTLNAASLPTCKVNPTVLINVYDRDPVHEANPILLATFTGDAKDDCAGFPQGGL